MTIGRASRRTLMLNVQRRDQETSSVICAASCMRSFSNTADRTAVSIID